jgi:hypothetical protein
MKCNLLHTLIEKNIDYSLNILLSPLSFTFYFISLRQCQKTLSQLTSVVFERFLLRLDNFAPQTGINSMKLVIKIVKSS